MTTIVWGWVGVGAWVVVGAGATVVVVGLTITGGGTVTGAAVVVGAGAAVVVGAGTGAAVVVGAGAAVVVVVAGGVTVSMSTAELSAALLSPKAAGGMTVTEFEMLGPAELTRLLVVNATYDCGPRLTIWLIDPEPLGAPHELPTPGLQDQTKPDRPAGTLLSTLTPLAGELQRLRTVIV
jgi:hypothetical protein